MSLLGGLFGSSGKGAARRAEQEAERQKYERNANINWLNALFGIDSDLDDGASKYASNQTNTSGNARGFYGAVRSAVARDEANAYAPIAAIPRYSDVQINANKTAREKLYADTGQAVRDYFTDDLNRQRDVASRNTRYSLARSGLSGGSVDADKRADLDSTYDRGLLEVSNRALDAEGRARSADESTRLNLINQIQSGLSGGDAVESAGRQLEANLRDAQATSRANQLGDLFAGLAEAQTPVAPAQGVYPLRRSGVGRTGSYFGTTGSTG